MLKYNKAFSSFSTNNLEESEKFYREILGLEVNKNSMGILELTIEGNESIIIYPKPNHVPATFTVLSFMVEDIEAAVDDLLAKGVIFEIYGGDIQTDEKGISRSDKGPNIAWFKDPAENILSVLEARK
jgi:catechol 2,3-dioxygenase-like lactoylglutathione lyase family enzyme